MFDETYSTYPEDLKLFKELGLEPFDKILNWSSIKVGECEVDNCAIEIFVEGYPAQFWRFIIHYENDSKKEVRTGSGSLTQYWESIRLISSGCLVISDVNFAEKD
jgi:hypothetical protein